MNMSLQEWLANYKTSRPHERLGQAFVNDFIKGSWPELFHQRNDDVSLDMINIWLKDICTYPMLPQMIDREKVNAIFLEKLHANSN